MDSGILIPGFTPENPVVVGDCTCESQPDGSERRVELKDYEGDVSVVKHEDDDGEVHSDGEDSEDVVQYAAEVEQWQHTFAGTRSQPQSQRVVGGYISLSSPAASSSSPQVTLSSAPASSSSPPVPSTAPASPSSLFAPSEQTSTTAAPDRRVSQRKRTQPQRYGAPVASNPPSRGETQWPAPQQSSTAEIQRQQASSTQPHSTGVSTRAKTQRLQQQAQRQVEEQVVEQELEQPPGGRQLRPRKRQRLYN
jgi:hypothetical protein